MERYRVFGNDRQSRKEGILPSISVISTELHHLGMDKELTESLWIRIKRRAGTDVIIVGATCKTEQIRCP